MADETVLLGHGSGGTMMKRIIDDVFAATYGSEELAQGNDAALLPAPAPGERLAFSTDTFVVTPHFFPGGNIGRHKRRQGEIPLGRHGSRRGLPHG